MSVLSTEVHSNIFLANVILNELTAAVPGYSCSESITFNAKDDAVLYSC